MRRLSVLIVLPLFLFALEKVNLIKDHSFENNSDEWKFYAKTRTGVELGPDAVSRHDSTEAVSGSYSAYCDTRTTPSSKEVDSAVVIQGFSYIKTVADFDSLEINYSIFPIKDDDVFYYIWLHTALVALYVDLDKPTYWFAGYTFKGSDLSPVNDWPYKDLGTYDFPTDTLWHTLERNVGMDLIASGFTSGSRIDSFAVIDWGAYFPPWRGQKIYFDDIRLTGYADYDVGIKELLSGDSVWKNTGYTPTARIKNFGRKPADSFLVIATIEGGAGVVYADTLTWSLTADTEDTVSFKEFKPSDAANYTLTVSTFMTPDESDEDDAVSRTLFGTAVAEPVLLPQDLTLQIEGVLRVSYSLPLGERGTISLYDPTGRRIESLNVQGEGSVNLKTNLSPGVYFVRLETGKESITRKAVVLR